MWQDEFRNVLKNEFSKLKGVELDFSLNKFAKVAGVSVGTMSELLNGKRSWNLTEKRAAEILSRIPMSISQRNQILVKIGEEPDLKVEKLAKEKYEFLVDLRHQGVILCLDLPVRERTIERLGERFGMTVEEVTEILNIGLLHGLVTLDAQGLYQRNKSFWTTSDNVPNEVIRRFHVESTVRARAAIERLSVTERDCTSMTFVGSSKRMDAVREEIRAFYKRIDALMSDEENNDEVYQVSISLFPLKKELE